MDSSPYLTDKQSLNFVISSIQPNIFHDLVIAVPLKACSGIYDPYSYPFKPKRTKLDVSLSPVMGDHGHASSL